MIISCSPVAVQLGVQLDILTVHLNSFCVEVYRVTNLFSSEFFVTFFLIDFCYRWKSKTEYRYSIRVMSETKCEVKMAGYWPSSFFAFLWAETKLRSIDSQKERGQYLAILTKQTRSIKNLILWLSGKFFLRNTAGSPERARWPARLGSQTHRAI